MKQLLFILLTFIATLNTLLAQDAKSYENTTWNVIRERLFSGENTKASRFEDDIRFQVIGAKTEQDSAIFIQLIDELNPLLETVQIKMVDTEPNFEIQIVQETGGLSLNQTKWTSGAKIVAVKMNLSFTDSLSEKESIKHIYYNIIRQLTNLYPPKHGSTGYGGIFDSDKASDAEFKEIDKDLLKKLYSKYFYKKLLENTANRRGYQYYLNLRFGKLINNLSFGFKVILAIIVFLLFLLKESKRKPNPRLLLYIRQRIIILLALPIFLSILNPIGVLPELKIRLLLYLGNYLVGFLFSLLVLIFIYYTEPIFLKKIKSFVSKQVLIFCSTIIALFIIPMFLMQLYFLFSSSSFELGITSIWGEYSSQNLLILFFPLLRVFYNFINYRIQSMVNQKDVELAKMKELKNQAELNALHSRINPHFLYNSLNSIASLAHIDANKTENMATGLSELFRYSINKENKTYVTVAEELEMVTKYLEIEKTRFGNRLVYEINADESTREKQIPKFLIQPLVENAIKHGLSKIKEMGKVMVEVKKVKKDLTIIIFDNGPDFPEEPIGGYGLQNLHDKLHIIYGSNAVINWENGTDKHFIITLKNQFQS